MAAYRTRTSSSFRYRWIPVGGIVLFCGLYFLAALFYPGGNETDPQAVGFSWLHNYWCNLLFAKAINGAENGAQPFAYAAMGVLSLSMIAFWWQFAGDAPLHPRERQAMRAAAVLSMASACFLATPWHDAVINISGAFGLVALAGVFLGLYRLRWRGAIGAGWFNVMLIVVNNILYYGPAGRYWLPLVQKISFAAVLLWVVWICMKMVWKDRINQVDR